MADSLRERGARVDYAQCYRRSRVNRPQGELAQLIKKAQPDCLVFSSGETLQFACQLLVPKDLPVVVPGQRVARLAQQQGFSHIVAAHNAGSDAIISALASVAESSNRK
jgi:uroporphyrinogen-III synthase